MTIHEGRGDLGTVRAASVVDAHAGLWVAGHRLQAAGCVLETVMRVMPEAEANEEAWHLLARTLDLLARAPAPAGPARLDPLVLGCQAKLLVVSGLLPMLGRCARCGAGPPLPAFSAAAGGALCQECAAGATRWRPRALEALAALVGRPLAEAREALPPEAAPGVERLVGLVLQEHLGRQAAIGSAPLRGWPRRSPADRRRRGKAVQEGVGDGAIITPGPARRARPPSGQRSAAEDEVAPAPSTLKSRSGSRA